MAIFLAQAIAGDLSGRVEIKIAGFFLAPFAKRFQGLHFPDVGITYRPEQIKIVTRASTVSRPFGARPVTGAAGGLLFGGATFIALALATGNNMTAKYEIRFEDGKMAVLEQVRYDKFLQCFLLYAKAKGLLAIATD